MFSIFKNGWKAFFETFKNDYMLIYLYIVNEIFVI